MSESSRSSGALSVPIRKLDHARGLELPRRASSGSAGLDLRAALETEVVLEPGRRAKIPTGLVIALPPGWEAQVRPRSGLAWNHGVTVVNSPGTVDSDYRGEVQVLLVHLGEEPFTVRRGDRIAQLVVCPTFEVEWRELSGAESDGPHSDRGRGGFGSTGRT